MGRAHTGEPGKRLYTSGEADIVRYEDGKLKKEIFALEKSWDAGNTRKGDYLIVAQEKGKAE